MDRYQFSSSFYHSAKWIKCRDGYARSQDGMCERCRAAGRLVKGTQVHHKIYLTPENINDPDISLNWDNLELLCNECHAKEHNAASDVNDGLCFDNDGNLIKL